MDDYMQPSKHCISSTNISFGCVGEEASTFKVTPLILLRPPTGNTAPAPIYSIFYLASRKSL
jgi:hypothetical protein